MSGLAQLLTKARQVATVGLQRSASSKWQGSGSAQARQVEDGAQGAEGSQEHEGALDGQDDAQRAASLRGPGAAARAGGATRGQ